MTSQKPEIIPPPRDPDESGSDPGLTASEALPSDIPPDVARLAPFARASVAVARPSGGRFPTPSSPAASPPITAVLPVAMPAIPPPAGIPHLPEGLFGLEGTAEEEEEEPVTHLGLPMLDAAVIRQEVAAVMRESEPPPALVQTPLGPLPSPGVDPRRAATRIVAKNEAAGLPPAAPRGSGAGFFASLARLAAAAVMGGVLAALGLALWSRFERSRVSVSEAAPVQATVEAAPAPGGPTDIEVAALRATPAAQRTSVQTLALALHERGRRAERLKRLAAAFPTSPEAVATKQKELFELALQPDLTLDALTVLAELPGPLGPDLIYALWQRLPGSSELAGVARALLGAADQRAKASPALAVALMLAEARTCDAYLSALGPAIAQGDQRSEPALRALAHPDGCGADGAQDCFPCLRTTPSLLTGALNAVAVRPGPGW